MPDDYTTTIDGVTFRPVSAATLAYLFELHSPLIFGGTLEPLDFLIFAWLHAAPLGEVVERTANGTAPTAAAEWAQTAPPSIFAVYCPRKIKALNRDLLDIFAERKTGYVPFPAPSASKSKWKLRGVIFGLLRSVTGWAPRSPKCTASGAK